MLRMRTLTAPRRNARGTPAGETRESTHRWVNTFIHARHLLKAGESRVVTPNYDTLYTNAWLDLAQGPVVISVPDTADRYYVLGFLDAYTNPFCHLGRRTTGTGAGRFLVAGPGWQGDVPEGMQLVRCPTPMVWIIGRILVDGPDDVAAVNALQEGYTITALGSDDTDGRVVDAWMAEKRFPDDALAYLRIVARGLRENPPPASEAALMARLAALGLGPQADAGTLDACTPAQREAIQAGYDAAREEMSQRSRGSRQQDNGPRASWEPPKFIGESFGTDYRQRAFVAIGYIGALCTDEAYYAMSYVDAEGERLDGSHRYVLRFEPHELAPVDCFWSVTLYSTRDFMLVPNALERYAVGDRSRHLRWGADGSLEIRIQHEAPASEDQGNWLPAPKDGFYLCLRAYQPRQALLDGSYQAPPVRRAD
ncbi:DUF1254 domain-containing protein [Verticiella sediminum]|uniref:DUF1254 domain-containing protein n=2 Tax=Verticiella sediminum TaxID=1247510 RepID=A0A556A8D6_9BURK|nr:DUF1254 domain-containing protein [Verticiella sediminum]